MLALKRGGNIHCVNLVNLAVGLTSVLGLGLIFSCKFGNEVSKLKSLRHEEPRLQLLPLLTSMQKPVEEPDFMAGIVTLKSQCVKLHPCAFKGPRPEHIHARYLCLMTNNQMYLKRKCGPEASWTTTHSESLAARLGKQNQLGVTGYDNP